MIFYLLLLFIIIGLYIVIKRQYSYWERNGYPYKKPQIPFGELDSVRKGQRSLGMTIYDVYKNSMEKFIGIYVAFQPTLLIRDAYLARDILTKDFEYFHDRGLYVDEEDNPITANLFSMKGQSWKSLRTKLTPSFTSGKIKGMFQTIDDVGNSMIDYLDTIVPEEGSSIIDLKDLLATYATDIIGSVIFGLDIDSFKNPNNQFRHIHRKLSERKIISAIRLTGIFLFPPVAKLLTYLGFQEEFMVSLTDVVKNIVEYREKNNVSRKDLMQLLIQLRNTGKINIDDNIWDVETAYESLKSMSIEKITAQMFVFYIAGSGTTAATTAFTIYELSQHPDLLMKAQKDVECSLAKHGEFTYEAVHDMKFLDLCVMETIRKYPGLPILNRQCTKDYPIPDTHKILKKGTHILISLFGIHRDDEYFPDPLKYDPERFLEANINYNPVAYMPFGEGPRHCIAQRLGKVNVKVALAKILINYKIGVQQKKELEFNIHGIGLEPKDNITVELSRRKKSNTF